MQFSQVSANTITVGATQTEIFDKKLRSLIYCYNKGAVDIFVGFWPNVTQTGEYVGFRVPAGMTLTIGVDTLGKIICNPVYAISSTGSVSADFIEI